MRARAAGGVGSGRSPSDPRRPRAPVALRQSTSSPGAEPGGFSLEAWLLECGHAAPAPLHRAAWPATMARDAFGVPRHRRAPPPARLAAAVRSLAAAGLAGVRDGTGRPVPIERIAAAVPGRGRSADGPFLHLTATGGAAWAAAAGFDPAKFVRARPFRRRYRTGPAAGRPRGWHFFAFARDPLEQLLRGGAYGADRFDVRIRPRFAAVPEYRPLAWRPAAAGVRLSVRVGGVEPAPARSRWRDGTFPAPYARRLGDDKSWRPVPPDRNRLAWERLFKERVLDDALAAARSPD